ncbi:hypothetical protein F3Y22_tig00012523pilonHSYRG00037 [Hibiscus syriacus]|uniref:Retrotransposon gag domain-containing protein n=1 Tax=Hibiscus syriacus TaxID=106335 RepID=A0A6A3C242_HIBSY|nr:hypothetical protein F3Y22_tig00012523pilonHSYRG00037 [Hibiscus syriacus]
MKAEFKALFDRNDGTRASSVDSANLSYKLKCPKFDGTDFEGWWAKMEQFLEAESVPEAFKIRTVLLQLDGEALQWHRFYATSKGGLANLEWKTYLRSMRERFAPEGFEDPKAGSVATKQLGTAERFHDDFIPQFLLEASDIENPDKPRKMMIACTQLLKKWV